MYLCYLYLEVTFILNFKKGWVCLTTLVCSEKVEFPFSLSKNSRNLKHCRKKFPDYHLLINTRKVTSEKDIWFLEYCAKCGFGSV